MYNQDLRRGGFVNPERNYDDEPERDLAMAVCSLVFGVAGILTGIFGIGFDVAALVTGIVVLRRRYFGRGFAIAGIITSAVGIAATIALTVFICIAGGDLRDELISTITDYMYYYSDGGMFDDYEDSDFDEEDYTDEEEYTDEEDSYSEDDYYEEDSYSEDDYYEEETTEDGSGDVYFEEETGTGVSTNDTTGAVDSYEEDTINASEVLGNDAVNALFSEEPVYDGSSESPDSEE